MNDSQLNSDVRDCLNLNNGGQTALAPGSENDDGPPILAPQNEQPNRLGGPGKPGGSRRKKSKSSRVVRKKRNSTHRRRKSRTAASAARRRRRRTARK